jgi:opacity protein-like surface antigen
MTRFAFITSIILGLSFTLPAQQSSTSDRHFTFNVGGGVTPVVGDINKRLDTGWNFIAGAGWNFTQHFALDGEYQYNGLGLDNSVLREFNVPDGNAHMWSLTANAIYRIHPESRFGAYLIGGGGLYHRVVQFTRPTLAQELVVDPFFGFVFPVLVPANVNLGTFTSNAGGVNAGGGFTFKLPNSDAKLYLESRYHWAGTHNTATQILPVTLGLRW